MAAGSAASTRAGPSAIGSPPCPSARLAWDRQRTAPRRLDGEGRVTAGAGLEADLVQEVSRVLEVRVASFSTTGSITLRRSLRRRPAAAAREIERATE